MSQPSQPLPSKISDLSKDQLNRIISYLSEKGFNSFKLTDYEQDHIDPKNFRESTKEIIDQRYIDLHIYTEWPQQISDYSGNIYYYYTDREEVAGVNERYNQVENFFSNTLLLVKNITQALDANKPQDEDLEDVKEAHDCCDIAVTRLWEIEAVVCDEKWEHSNGGFKGCIVSFLEELIECILKFNIVTKGRISLLGYKNPVLIKSKL